MGDKKDDSGLFGWKNWKIPDEWTVVARDRTPVSVSLCPAMLSSGNCCKERKLTSGRKYPFYTQHLTRLLTYFIFQPTSGRFGLDYDLDDKDNPNRNVLVLRDQYNPGTMPDI